MSDAPLKNDMDGSQQYYQCGEDHLSLHCRPVSPGYISQRKGNMKRERERKSEREGDDRELQSSAGQWWMKVLYRWLLIGLLEIWVWRSRLRLLQILAFYRSKYLSFHLSVLYSVTLTTCPFHIWPLQKLYTHVSAGHYREKPKVMTNWQTIQK